MAGKLIQRIAALAEGLALLGLGLAMVWFAMSEDYWVLMNPKFRWLTLSAGVVLALLGAVALFMGRRRGVWGRMMLVVMMVTMISVVDHAALLGPVGQADPAPTSKTGPSRLEWQGRQYIKINAMELFTVAEEGKQAKIGQNYVWRGMARRAPGLGENRFVALRTSIFCCLADAVAMGFVVQTPGLLPAEGQWVRLWGELKPLAKPIQGAGIVQTKGVFMSVASSDWVFVAHRVEPIPTPEVPFSFVFNRNEPYAY